MALHSSTASLSQLLLAPDKFFEQRPLETAPAATVVAVVAVLHVLVFFGGLLLVGVLASLLDGEVSIAEALGSVAGQGFGQSIVLGVLIFVNWLVVSTVLHIPTKLLHGEGTFGDTLAVVGWSSPVALLLPALTIAATMLTLLTAGSADAAVSQVESVRGTIGGVSALGVVVTLIWQGIIWLSGLRQSHDIEEESAAVAVLVTVALGIITALAA